MQKKKKTEIICRCNSVSRKDIEDAIANGGCDTLNKIFDATTAGVGPCGGSCRRKLKPLLDHYLQYGFFPEKICEDLSDKICLPKISEEDEDPGT
jgi:NAD(P)H-nitrite reductase large subunit